MIAILLVSLLAVGAVGFWILWASSPTLGRDQYRQGALVHSSSNGHATPTPVLDRLRLVTFNAGYASGAANNTPQRVPREVTERNLDCIGRALAKLNADFIVLQEVDLDSRRSHRIDQLAWLLRHTGHPHAATAFNWDIRYLPWPYWPVTAHFGRVLSGQALLSRFPIQSHRKVTFPKPPMQTSWYNRFFIDRTLHACTVDLAGTALHLAGCHLESFYVDWRQEQARHLTQALAAIPAGPLILAGDFNAIPAWATPPPALHDEAANGQARDDTIAHIESTGLRGLFTDDRWAARESDTYTYASFLPVACIDHAFCNDGIEILDGGVCRDTGQASDHFPVWLDFRLKERA